MKAIKFWIANLLVVLGSILMTSCDNGLDEMTIIGKWEVIDASRTYYFVNDTEDIFVSESYEVGMVWEFTKDGQLLVSDVADRYSYTVSDNIITTEYATKYYSETAQFFRIENHTADELVLSVRYAEKDKVGERDVTHTLTFKQVVE
jgi:hypothetical protein